MRDRAAALKAGVGVFALSWATMVFGVTGAGTSSPGAGTPSLAPAASQVPSIQLLRPQTSLAGTCGGSSFNVSTFINIGTSASADVRLSAPTVGIIEEFTDETGKNIGPYNAKYPTFHIPSFGGGLAPNTPITLTITTYTGPGLTGSVTFTSSITFNCTTGALIPKASSVAGGEPVPALSPAMLLALILLSGLLAATALRSSHRTQLRISSISAPQARNRIHQL